MTKYPGLTRRGKLGVYQIRVAVPRDLHGVLGRKKVTLYLRTSDFEKAVDRYFAEVAKIRAALKQYRNDPAGGFFSQG